MNTNLKGELTLMDTLGVKPNYAALGRKCNFDWRTIESSVNIVKKNIEIVKWFAQLLHKEMTD